MTGTLQVSFEDHELKELRVVLDRAMNTWEPDRWPAWLPDLSAAVDQRLEKLGLVAHQTPTAASATGPR